MTVALFDPRPGSVVRFRGRDWVVVPSDDEGDVILLRPIGGTDEQLTGVYRPFLEAGLEALCESRFPDPDPEQVGDHVAGRLLLDAVRLLLRDGAAPLRCLGRLGFRPRPYQFVPLIMALRQDPVRLLIADDVGLGKTLEALLIVRELLDRGEIRRVAVLCPPYLCEQWQQEMQEKFHLDAVVIRPGTLGRLERDVPPHRSVFQYYDFIVASIDLVKSDRYRPVFLQHCPEMVVVDEVHGAAEPPGHQRGQQQRHELLKAVASTCRHLVLLTATPHSGVVASFRSILGLLRPEFRDVDLSQTSSPLHDALARHFIQRRRADVRRWLDEDSHFPQRKPEEVTYQLSREYRELFEGAFELAHRLVRRGDELQGRSQRLCYWAALALLRSVMSSPAAAEAALRVRLGDGDGRLVEEDSEAMEDLSGSEAVLDPADVEAVADAAPVGVVEEAGTRIKGLFEGAARSRLRALLQQASAIRERALAGDLLCDTKAKALVGAVRGLLHRGFAPIVWCRYIPTVHYLVEVLRRELGDVPGLAVDSVTGEVPDEARRERVRQLERAERPVLVATDCLSEGINLQERFDAVIHYDLPWNPNRLEQREGRVDRFGQRALEVRAVLLYGTDNPVDGAVMEVLLRKAREIREQLGVHVPVPEESTTVVEALVTSLFRLWRGARGPQQLALDLPGLEEPSRRFHEEWHRAAQREKESRTRFAQRAIKPEEVRRELEATDAVLGDPKAVRRFVVRALTRLGVPATESDGRLVVRYSYLPRAVQERVGERDEQWAIAFNPAGSGGAGDAEAVTRNHPLVAALAEHLLAGALEGAQEETDAPAVARCGAILTAAVPLLTCLYLLRARYLLQERQEHERERTLLAEEALVVGVRWVADGHLGWLDPDEARALLERAEPSGNLSADERRSFVRRALEVWRRGETQDALRQVLAVRVGRVTEAHRRIRTLTREPRVRAEAVVPPDLVGIYVLVPATR